MEERHHVHREETDMADERSVDEYLGFASKAVAKRDPELPADAATPEDDGAYEDSWYQVLRARTDRAERD
jgi:hypothetical protein